MNVLVVDVGCCAGNNANAFLGGFRLWEQEHTDGSTRTKRHR
jgi:hypothetical protein